MLRLYRGNRLERLADRLAEVLADPAGLPLAPETVVVQGPGTARWVAARLASRLGVCANVRFPQPAAFIWDCFRAVLPALPAGSAYEPERLLWRVFGLLDRVRGEPWLGALGHYLEGSDELKRLRLAGRLAETLDQYLVYRPDWIRDWERGGSPGPRGSGGEGGDGGAGGSRGAARESSAAGEDWQAELWRRLVAEGGRGHWVHAQDAFLAAPALRSALPARVAVFALPTLSPSYLALLAHLAGLLDVHLFLLDPSREYWSDIESPGATARRRARWRREGRSDASGYYAVGHPLLASLGRMGRELLDQVLEYDAEEEELWEDPVGDSVGNRVGDPVGYSVRSPLGDSAGPSRLRLLQRDVLELRNRGREPDAPPLPIPEGDRSLQVHACHGPLREVQVLHDGLLDLFERLPGLEPRDVLVLAPDPDAYAPHVEAVFGALGDERFIPWSAARRDPAAGAPAVAAVLQLLDLPASRLPASEVLSLLEVAAVARRLALDEAAVEALRGWVRESGVRWGLDAEARSEAGLPALDETTWAFGLRRLFLGYAMPEDAGLFAGVLPCPGPEGSSAPWLGALAGLVERLGRWRQRLAGRHPAGHWAALLRELVDDFLVPTDEEEEARLLELSEAAAGVADAALGAGYAGAFGREVFRERLVDALSGRRGAPPVLAGGVTFAGLGQLPGVPARVIWLLGMNGADFPRTERPPGFDRMARHRLRGDRSRRDEDRQRFLDALLAARDVFAVSYVGRSARDNAPMVPSVVVSEFLDYLQQAFTPQASTPQASTPQASAPRASPPQTRGGVPGGGGLVTEHPLQPFSRRYFDGGDPQLFSYAREWLPEQGAGPAGAGALTSTGSTAPAAPGAPGAPAAPAATLALGSFVRAPLPLPEEAGREIELGALERFLENPARHFLRERLGVRLAAGEAAPQDAESFRLDGLTAYRVRGEALGAALAGLGLEEAVLPLAVARGDLPLGPVGRLDFARGTARVPDLAAVLRPVLAHALPALEVDLVVDGFRLRGWLTGVTPGGLVTYRVTKVGAKDRLRLWVRHLALCALAPPGVALASRHFGEDGDFVLGPVADAAAELRALAEAWRQGLAAPLPFFPETSLAWVRAERAGTPERDCWRAVRKHWHDGHQDRGEALDVWVALAFRDWEPPDAAFVATARAVAGPLLAAEVAEPSRQAERTGGSDAAP